MSNGVGTYSLTSSSDKKEAATLAVIKSNIEALSQTMKGVKDSVDDMGKQLSSTKTSVKGAWHEIRQIKNRLDDMGCHVDGKVKDHEDACIARARVRERAIRMDSDANLPRPTPEDSQIFLTQQAAQPAFQDSSNVTVPKWVIIMFVVIGAMLVGAGIMIGSTMSKGDVSVPALLQKK